MIRSEGGKGSAGMDRFECYELCVQSPRRPELSRFLDAWMPALDALPGRRVRWGVDVDPISL